MSSGGRDLKMPDFLDKWKQNLHAEYYEGDSIPVDLEPYDSIINELKDKEEYTRILDIGCGNGYLVETLNHSANIVYGITICEKEGNRDNVYVHDMHDLPFVDNMFDVVIAQHSLEHALSPVLVLREINRVLVPNGLLIVDTPVTPGGVEGGNKAHFYTFSCDQYIDMLKKNGFIINKAEYIKDYFRIHAYKGDR